MIVDNSVISGSRELTLAQKLVISKSVEHRLPGFKTVLQEMFTNPQLYEDVQPEGYFQRCFEEQEKQNALARYNRFYRNSHVGNKRFIREFAPDSSRGLTPQVLEMLKECEFVKNGVNIVFSGPAGSGKTALAQAVANEAMMKGMSARFFRFSDLSLEIESKDSIALARFRDRLSHVRVLILDDYGLTKIPDKIVSGLNEIADARYGKGTTIITTQLRKSSLKDVMDKSPIRDAIMDRLVRGTDIEITLKGESWRGAAGELK